MSLYDDYLKDQKKNTSSKNGGSLYDAYLKDTQPKQPSKVGKVLSKVGNFAKDLAKEGIGATLVRPGARATEAVTRTLFPNSQAAKGYELMSDAGESQKLLGIDVAPVKAGGQGGGKQIVGEALETASWLYGGEGLKAGAKAVKAVKGLKGVDKLASKKTFAEIAVKQIPELAKLGAIGSASATIGNQLQKTAGTDDKINWNQAIKDITIGTLATPVVGLALTKVFGTKASKILEARQALRDTEIASNKARIGEMKPTTPIVESIPEVVNKVEQQLASKVEQPVTQPTVEAPVTPEQTQRISNFKEVFAKQDTNQPPEFKGGDLKTRALNFEKKFTENPEHMKRVAMGIERDPLVPQEDALGAMRKLAQDNNDIKLIDELSDSNVGSQAGSNFNGLKLAGENDIGKVWHDLKMSVKKKMPNAVKKSEKETQEAVGKLKKYFKENNIPEKEFNNIMDEFVCK